MTGILCWVITGNTSASRTGSNNGNRNERCSQIVQARCIAPLSAGFAALGARGVDTVTAMMPKYDTNKTQRTTSDAISAN
ncbi:hypothetical protein [Bacterioplanes sanyensis]|uniref:hypothetical protein n=1 Tax=Bacterioplanes sanyensis TaxID=1249553 RepID=UPI00167B4B19|nr:hypothetical protein [Bacterioplanes sanyensis]